MRSRTGPDGNIHIKGDFHEEIFTNVCAGAGWPDEQPGAIVAIGRRLDGRYHILEEARGSLFEIKDTAIEFVDRFLVESLWIDATDLVSASYLRKEVCPFHTVKDRPDRPGVTLRNSVKRFRLRGQDAYPVIRPTPEKILRHFRSTLEQVRGLILTNRAIINEKRCASLTYAMRQPLDYTLASPVIRAMVFALMPLVDSDGIEAPQVRRKTLWYSNKGR